MADLIDRQALLEFPIRLTNYDKEHGDEHFVVGIESVLECAEHLPAVDAVEVVALEKWLYEIAMNNMGAPVEDMAAACEIIISRLGGLRRFAEERREENG